MKRLCFIGAICILVYISSYIYFRQTNIEVWDKDNHAYVIFPKSAPYLYYMWRPLTYVDAAIFGMRFHIGPHQ